MQNAKIIITDENGREYTFDRIFSFEYEKSLSLPYTSLTASVCCKDIFDKDISSIRLVMDDIVVHSGFAEIFKSYRKNNCCFIVFTSKGFSALMMQNYLEPKLYTKVTFNSLMDNYVTMPEVTHEDNSETTGYFYVSENKSLWDSVCSFGYKLKNTIPYITGTNKVNISLPEQYNIIEINKNEILESGRESDYHSIVSDIYMQDAEGEYDKFSLHCDLADKLNLSRRKEISLDKQFLYSPQTALEYRISQYIRKQKLLYILCNGFLNAEIYDLIESDIFSNFNNVSKKVFGISVQGNSEGITSKILVFYN